MPRNKLVQAARPVSAETRGERKQRIAEEVEALRARVARTRLSVESAIARHDGDGEQLPVVSGQSGRTASAAALLRATAVADMQLARVGDEFTKNDYVAVLVALEPALRPRAVELLDFTMEALRARIRLLVYDPERLYE